MPEFDVLVVGDANPDLLLRGDVRPRFGQAEQLLTAADLVLGGSAAITATGCARLGLRTALFAAVADDVFGTLVRQQLAARDVTLLPADGRGAPTGLTVVLSEPDDRGMLTLPGTISALRPTDLTDDLLTRAKHVHVASLYLQPALSTGLAEIFHRARRLGLTTSLDTNWDPTEKWESLTAILQNTDVFLPNAAELQAITGLPNPDEAAATLVRNGTAVVMKDGPRGARAWWPGGTCTAPGRPVDVIDTTGAGDSFNAGFLAARLADRPLTEAVAWAAAAGSLSTRAPGGTAAQAFPHELP
ncbi:sugar/nucleoside kinase (ribokinase family) [Actinoplanes tereljensis]|uniref:Sugar kinase n=1 Tax=Paractinoplanes tereljensis TaxID=571912 RepID=A0A919TQD0_9ACTN|nr:sugar kinase [Actinoplanes tereljensis]GIF18156.1 sugar kinase [Actinoplanes tereljensis]